MTRAAALCALASAPSCCDWSKHDTVLELAHTGLVLEDWRQTQRGVADCLESNPVIGPCGQNLSPAVYFPVTLAVHAAVAALLPPGWMRTSWQAFGIGEEFNAVWANWSQGYH